ncbi:acetyl-CoA carboxylase, biotin carboxyl carrier protein [Silvanigrella aquatica]|uniref:Biotin carboxyl carrier protein of acetyl-CoA carboxylase n=1 Tax=Silvanigrella aquatica TaxID=1915309 RepID=A0A1L4D4I9_9BACT|nr:acetyl-CoA carboxylase, biotin carboxyl carrier protein [Silvanigrella aquatica]
MDVTKIEKLMTLMAKHGFDVIEAESSGEKISLARNVSQASVFQQQTVLPQNANQLKSGSSGLATSMEFKSENAAVKSEETKKLPEGTTITSPFVGTFYRSPSPDSPSFVEIGSKIRKGQSLCIVEAMKLMNEIESEMDGEIVAILIDNAKPVEFGTPLFIVAPAK